MTLIDYFNQFWREFKKKQFSPNESLLYSYLLNVWNTTGRKEQFECNTKEIEIILGMNKTTLTRCRENLRKRGLIQYNKGDGKIKSPYYFLCNVTDNVTDNVTTHRDIEFNNISSSAHARTHVLGLEELKKELLGANIWIEEVQRSLLRNYKVALHTDEIKEKIEGFFLHLSSIGTDVKTIEDAKRHFVNWILKQKEIEKKDGERIQDGYKPSYTSKQEANSYAIKQFAEYRQARESGMATEMEKPF